MKYLIEIEENDINILSTALGNMPFNQVNTLIGKLQAQIVEQTKAAQLKDNTEIITKN